eukprot:TRINITY_DN3037_c0_g1_i2.p1 TRINITY_DN3037_c0_g1~~TRINITY_DN3037_c0_g1_i2.p1  ORF type:complete len:835 (-),score=158.60 TRINITY_DN3037_c0_g1_i2:297-2801(-)
MSDVNVEEKIKPELLNNQYGENLLEYFACTLFPSDENSNLATDLDYGWLYVTTKEIIFVGSYNTITLVIKEINSIRKRSRSTLFPDILEITCENHKRVIKLSGFLSFDTVHTFLDQMWKGSIINPLLKYYFEWSALYPNRSSRRSRKFSRDTGVDEYENEDKLTIDSQTDIHTCVKYLLHVLGSSSDAFEQYINLKNTTPESQQPNNYITSIIETNKNLINNLVKTDVIQLSTSYLTSLISTTTTERPKQTGIESLEQSSSKYSSEIVNIIESTHTSQIFLQKFNIPISEKLIIKLPTSYWYNHNSATTGYYENGWIMISTHFLLYGSGNIKFTLPLSHISEVKKRSSTIGLKDDSIVIVTNCRKELFFKFDEENERNVAYNTVHDQRNKGSDYIPDASVTTLSSALGSVNKDMIDDTVFMEKNFNLNYLSIQKKLEDRIYSYLKKNSFGLVGIIQGKYLNNIINQFDVSIYSQKPGSSSSSSSTPFSAISSIFSSSPFSNTKSNNINVAGGGGGGGLPDIYRSHFWKLCSGALYKEINSSVSYNDVLEEIQYILNQKYHQIEKDIDNIVFRLHNKSESEQTRLQNPHFLPSKVYYKKQTSDDGPIPSPNLDSLTRLMKAFAYKNKFSSYSENLSKLASVLLLYMDEEGVYWLLMNLCEEIYPSISLYQFPSVVDMENDIVLFLIKHYYPALHDHMRVNNINIKENLIAGWLMNLSIGYSPLELSLLLLDCWLCINKHYHYRVLLGLIDFYQNQLIKTLDSDEFSSILYMNKGESKDIIEDIMKVASTKYDDFPVEDVESIVTQHQILFIQSLTQILHHKLSDYYSKKYSSGIT